ncbi:alpha/beta fold hydrolase [Mycolicibacter kumamotonensis]|uniref:Alpha/beta hydrolase n=1 Tax=Mycolicibacter kumamotonensis TaxID=354243 RepID=A0A1B8SF70_9MYCO|nr:alpha/beta hydrolase [Mycolicibacter kumamotonensis]OBY31365.1 alpha/beta hydrolase [Mycolicibacter kumamotonensis]
MSANRAHDSSAPVVERVPTVDGLSLAVDFYRCDAPRAVVLLLHGGGQSRHAWDVTAQRLHQRGYTVAAYDARGHGDSDWDPDGRYDIERLGSDLLAVRAYAGSARPVAAIGASLGGLTILGTHLLAPSELWQAVVLVDITPRMQMHGARRVLSFMSAHPEGFDSLESAADVIAAYNPHRPRPENVDGLQKVLRRRGDGRWAWRWDPAFATSNFQFLQSDSDDGAEEFEMMSAFLVDGARRVSAPALLVRGLLSDIVSEETVKDFLTLVPHAQTVDVSGAGHMVAGDNNDAFSTAVVDFLDRTV